MRFFDWCYVKHYLDLTRVLFRCLEFCFG